MQHGFDQSLDAVLYPSYGCGKLHPSIPISSKRPQSHMRRGSSIAPRLAIGQQSVPHQLRALSQKVLHSDPHDGTLDERRFGPSLATSFRRSRPRISHAAATFVGAASSRLSVPKFAFGGCRHLSAASRQPICSRVSFSAPATPSLSHRLPQRDVNLERISLALAALGAVRISIG